VAEPRAEPTGDVEQVARAGFHLVAEALDGAADGDDARDGAVVPQDRLARDLGASPNPAIQALHLELLQAR
jgi:hypothetical protein